MNEHHTTLDEGQECLVGDPALLESILDEGTRQWYFWQPGVLQMSPIPAAPGYLGGLTRDAARLVLVRQEAYHRRRRFLLSAYAQRLGMRSPEAIEAFCDQAEQEVIEDPNPRPHPVFAAASEASQLSYWLAQMA